MKEQWENMENKKIKKICEQFCISAHMAKIYLSMTQEEMKALDSPAKYKKRTRSGDDFANIIYKMMLDEMADDIIFHYIKNIGVTISDNTLWDYIRSISTNNFPDRPHYYALKLKELCYPADVTVIQRNDILKYLLTVNPKTKKDEEVEKYVDIILQKYPIAAWVKEGFQYFHRIMLGDSPDAVDEFITKYSDTKIGSFCDGLKKDIAPVKNAISLEVSSGFVEGNNNKFKLMKRIVYGRSGLVNLEKKCRLAFMQDTDDFSLGSLI